VPAQTWRGGRELGPLALLAIGVIIPYMRRALLIAALVAGLVQLVVGQRMAAARGGGVVGAAHFGGPRVGFPGNRIVSHGSFVFASPSFGVRWGWGFGPFRPWGFRPWRPFYPGWGWGYAGYYPAYYYPSYSYSYPVASYSNPYSVTDSSSYSTAHNSYPDLYYEQNQNITRELDRLSDEVEQLRRERDTRSAASQPTTPEAPRATMLIFRDKHVEEVQNYAVVGQTLWTFNEDRAKKVPLAQLDIDATRKLNDERGIEFVLPHKP